MGRGRQYVIGRVRNAQARALYSRWAAKGVSLCAPRACPSCDCARAFGFVCVFKSERSVCREKTRVRAYA